MDDLRYHTGPELAPVQFSLGALQCYKISVGTLDNNAYLLVSANNEAVLIDAAADAIRLWQLIRPYQLRAIITTHRHQDHWQALAKLATLSQAKLYCGGPDQAAIEQATGTRQLPIWDDDQLQFGAIQAKVIGLRGHTPGGVALVVADEDKQHIFTGDSLFPGGVGKTANPQDFQQLFGDVTTKIFDRYPDETLIHPGHGDSSTLGAERPQLAQWAARGW